MRFVKQTVLLLMVVLTSQAEICHAEFTFLGPTPYLSAADSPFAEYLDGPNFFLEDFEDGELNTPGIFEPNIPPPIIGSSQGVVLLPGNDTDAVDIDTGVINGSGQNGHSYRSNFQLSQPTFPATIISILAFSFDSSILGYYPTKFGFVWTDGNENSSLIINVVDTSGYRERKLLTASLGNKGRGGGTEEDMFFGVSGNIGIVSVEIESRFVSEVLSFEFFEIDHLQYGRLPVPEPSTSCIALTVLLFGSSLNTRQDFLRNKNG